MVYFSGNEPHITLRSSQKGASPDPSGFELDGVRGFEPAPAEPDGDDKTLMWVAIGSAAGAASTIGLLAGPSQSEPVAAPPPPAPPVTTTPPSVVGPTPPTTAAEPTIACFDAAPTVMLGQQSRLDASCSSPRGSLTYEWDLGDGRSRTGRVISPVYRVAGTYAIELTVRQQSSGSALDTDVMTIQIEVQAQPSPGLPSPTGSAGGSADLAIEIVGIVTPRVVTPFGIIYFMTVTNFGPGAATGVTVTDSLPPTVSLNGVSGALCSTAGATLTCDLNSLPAFSSKTLTVDVLVSSSVSVGETILNSATVTAATGDPSLGNNTATSVVQIVFSQKAPDGSVIPTSFTSSLEGWPTTVHGNVLSNGNQLDAVRSSTPFQHQVKAVLGRNRIEAYLESTSEAEGIWRFDFSRAKLFVSGSFEVRQGRVLSQSSHAIVFQLHGNTGQKIEFAYQLAE